MSQTLTDALQASLAAPAPCADPVAHWLLIDGREQKSSEGLIEGFCRRLADSGFPLFRFFVSVRTLHPQVAAQGFHWWRNRDQIKIVPREHGIYEEPAYLDSPIRLLHERHVSELRRRIEDPAAPIDFPILKDLKAEGVTDYLALPILFTSGTINTLAIASDRPGGFTAQEIAYFKGLLPIFTIALEVREIKRIASTLLDTYLGHDAGQRVLQGQIRRGAGVTMAAAIFYCDLRGFTALSESMAPDQVIELLNDYFGCMAAPVQALGGEVLKFIGDAMLAIFPIADDLDRDRACRTALKAGRQALMALDELNLRRREAGEATLEVGLALHTGTVMYGNIGAPDRLDFTVIGHAVNLTTRLERLCRQLGRRLVASERFASPCGIEMVPLGRFEVPGVHGAQAVFGLPDEVSRLGDGAA
ncbi:adenylate/guanylate cyclase domain-containing protein [Hypericibacter sp.]|uniref:adenylate/guanylate cyclase domain-containing protein n=1 Tax=Hypericibacter sp. TaxID=2705401 RepID=UPI003D6D56A0